MATVTPLSAAGSGVAIACHDRALERTVREHLDRYGIESFRVDEVDPSDPALMRGQPQLLLVELRKYEGLDSVAALRRTTNIPTITIIDEQRTIDPVEAIEVGADDFVVKPCSPRELAAKVRAWLRRVSPDTVIRPPRFGVLEINPCAREVRVRGALVPVPPREFDLLAFLAQRPRHAFSRPELLAEVWSASASWLGPATVTEHVRRLRQRIEDDPGRPRWLQTVRRVGYRFEPGPEIA